MLDEEKEGQSRSLPLIIMQFVQLRSVGMLSMSFMTDMCTYRAHDAKLTLYAPGHGIQGRMCSLWASCAFERHPTPRPSHPPSQPDAKMETLLLRKCWLGVDTDYLSVPPTHTLMHLTYPAPSICLVFPALGTERSPHPLPFPKPMHASPDSTSRWFPSAPLTIALLWLHALHPPPLPLSKLLHVDAAVLSHSYYDPTRIRQVVAFCYGQHSLCQCIEIRQRFSTSALSNTSGHLLCAL